MLVDTTITEVKKNRLSTTVVVEYVDPTQKVFITDDGVAVTSFDFHDGWNMQIKREQAELLVEWANNLVKAFDDHKED